MPRQPLPADDLYARLEVPADASPEAIEIAWRALLKLHHPDVAGDDGLDNAKRINVAHDWLSDPVLRERYDRERHPGHLRRNIRDGWRPRQHRTEGPAAARSARRPAAGTDTGSNGAASSPAATLERFIQRAARLTPDELDRLSVSEGPGIAFVASIRRFLSPEQVAAVEATEARLAQALGPASWSNLRIRDAVLAAAHELLLHEFLDESLGEPFRSRVADRLTRGWEAAVGQPRYGPNGAAVRRLVERAQALTDEEGQALAAAVGVRSAAEPWPRGIDPDEDEVFRVSSALAARDATAAPVFDRLDRRTATRARRAVAQAVHAMVLRHAFTADEFAALLAPWRAATGDPGTGRVRSERDGARQPGERSR